MLHIAKRIGRRFGGDKVLAVRGLLVLSALALGAGALLAWR